MSNGYGWIREILLAAGMILVLYGSLVLMTGSSPPMVVVESQSMMMDENSHIGSIDPGDIILVTDSDKRDVITYAEAVEPGSRFEGYSTHGMPGDVVIYRKNGGNDTPVIHRAILFVSANEIEDTQSDGTCLEGELDEQLIGSEGSVGACILTWDVRGTSISNVSSISLNLTGYSCQSHGYLAIQNWVPEHEGYLTSGDNPRTNGCTVDQLIATGSSGSGPHYFGLRDEFGKPVTAVRSNWVSGIAGPEIPWFGIVKLAASSNSSEVTSDAWTNLFLAVTILLGSVMIIEKSMSYLVASSPEFEHSNQESEKNRNHENSYEEE
jgi:signal peptidase I